MPASLEARRLVEFSGRLGFLRLAGLAFFATEMSKAVYERITRVVGMVVVIAHSLGMGWEGRSKGQGVSMLSLGYSGWMSQAHPEHVLLTEIGGISASYRYVMQGLLLQTDVSFVS